MTTERKFTFGHVVRDLCQQVEGLGFFRSGATLARREPDAWVLVEVQASQPSFGERVRFAVNCGVACVPLLLFESVDPAAPPRIDDCHWRTRLPCDRGEWWTITSGEDLTRVGAEFVTRLRSIGLPQMLAVAQPWDLFAYWRDGGGTGLTDFQRLMYLSALAKHLGQREVLDRTIHHLCAVSEGKPCAAAAARHISRLTV